MKSCYTVSLAALRIWLQVVVVEHPRCKVVRHLDVGLRDTARQFGAFGSSQLLERFEPQHQCHFREQWHPQGARGRVIPQEALSHVTEL